MRKMTDDTKRALEVIEPIAKVLGIRVWADGYFLYCDGQAIGISCNSTYATVVEFIGYAVAKLGRTDYRFDYIFGSKKAEQAIKRYWVNSEMAEMIIRANEELEHET